MFGTFIFKEVSRERQKDLVDDLKSEEGSVEIQNQIDSVYQMVWKTAYINAAKNIKDVLSSADHVDNLRLEYRSLTGLLSSLAYYNRSNMGNNLRSIKLASKLCSELPTSSISKELVDLSNLKERAQSCNKEGEEVEGLLNEELVTTVLPALPWRHSPDFQVTLVKLEYWRSDEAPLIRDTGNLIERLLEKEHSSLEKAEENYRVFTNVSYGLYTLGFLVTLGGQLLGIKTSSSAE